MSDADKHIEHQDSKSTLGTWNGLLRCSKCIVFEEPEHLQLQGQLTHRNAFNNDSIMRRPLLSVNHLEQHVF